MPKSLSVVWGLFFVAAGLLGCAHKSPESSDPQFVTIKIYHTNDVHSHLLPNAEGRGGLAYLASVIKVVRKQEPDALILDAGDYFKKGSIPARKTKDDITAQIISEFPYDYRVVGNNELKTGVERLLEYSKKYESGRLLSANFVDKNDKPVFPPYVEIKNQGLKIAIIGLTLPFELEKDVQASVEKDSRAPYKVLPTEETVKKYLPELRARNDLVLLLDHIGYRADLKLAQTFQGSVDAIVGGHSHVLTDEFDGPVQATPPVVQDGEYGQQVGVFQLTYDRNLKKLVRAESLYWSVGEDFQIPDAAVQEKILASYKKHAPDALEVIGQVGEELSLISEEEPFESGYHDWVASLMKKYTKADIALLNREALREPLREGPLNRDQLWMATPYEDELAMVELAPEKLKKLIRSPISRDWKKDEMFPFAFSGAGISVQKDKNDSVEVTNFRLPQKSKIRVVIPKYVYAHCEEIFASNDCTEKMTPLKITLQSIQLDEFKVLKMKKLSVPQLDRVQLLE